MRAVKIGLIGCGAVTLKAHLPALINDPTAPLSAHAFRVTAICGLDDGNLAHIQALLPQVEVYTDHQKLLGEADCEAVLVATGEKHHPVICRDSLEQGKYVLCEKPLGENSRILREILGNVNPKLADRMQVAFNKRFHPVYLRYQSLRASGELGKVIGGDFYFCTQQGRKPGWDGLLSNLIHYCDLICSIFGEMDAVRSTSNIGDNGISLSVSLKAKSGAIASLFFTSAASWKAGLHEEWQLVDDRRNRLVSRNGTESHFFKHGSDTICEAGSNSVFWLPDPGGYKTQLKSFYRLVCGEQDAPEVTLDDALRAHELFDVIRQQNECTG